MQKPANQLLANSNSKSSNSAETRILLLVIFLGVVGLWYVLSKTNQSTPYSLKDKQLPEKQEQLAQQDYLAH